MIITKCIYTSNSLFIPQISLKLLWDLPLTLLNPSQKTFFLIALQAVVCFSSDYSLFLFVYFHVIL